MEVELFSALIFLSSATLMCFVGFTDFIFWVLQFGKAIIDFQNTQFKLADMLTSVQASRSLVANAATALDSKSPWATASAAMAKRYAKDIKELRFSGLCNRSCVM